MTLTDLSAYLKLASGHPLLDAPEERRLSRLIRAGREASLRLADGEPACARLQLTVETGRKAREQLVASNLRLVISIARGFPRHTLVDLSDLIQAGNSGLLIATEQFDPDRGFRFSTYATTWIRSRMIRAIDEGTSALKIPVDLVNELRTAVKRADADGVPLGETHRRLVSAYAATSLDVELSDGVHTLGDLQPSNDDEVEAVVESRLRQGHVREAVGRLPYAHRQVVLLRFGYVGDRLHSLRSIAARLGVSERQTRRLLNEAMEQLAVSLDHPSNQP